MDPSSDPQAAGPRIEGEPSISPGYRLVFILDPDGRIRQVLEASGIGGWPQEGLVGRTLGDVSTERAGAERGNLWDVRVALAREATVPALYSDRVPGTPIDSPASVSSTVIPIRTTAGELESILVELEDRNTVGPREAQVREHEDRFRRLAETLPQMVWESDGAGNARYLSDKWREFTGRPIRELLGRGYAEHLHPDDLAAVAAARDQAATTTVVEFRLRRHDGEYRWMEAHLAMVRDAQGNPVQAIGTAADVTERRAAEEARLRTQKREMVGTLLGGIGHDFNNVISAILSNAALARLELSSGASADTSIAEIERGAGRAADLVKRVLAQGREEGVPHEEVNVGEILREAADLLRAGLPATAELRIDIDPAVPPISGDATQVHQVVVNLITNARQALASARGRIHAAVTLEPADVELGERARRNVVLRVRDDGPGMLEAVRARVFDPYFTTKPAGEGSGLGLAAVQTIARAHRGTVEVDSSPGQGATFTVTFPVEETASRRPDRTPGAPPVGGGQRLLYVDDEPALVLLATRALPADGLEPDGFTDPREALAAFNAEPDRWSVLVTDLSMPGLDGLTLIERIRSTRPHLPVILTSGYLRDADRDRAADLGVTAIVPKPCSMADLAKAVMAATRTAAR